MTNCLVARSLPRLLALALAAVPTVAQTVREIAAFTSDHASIDFDTVGLPGPTTLTEVNRAGRPLRDPFAAITLRRTTAGPGVYDFQTDGGRGLGLEPGGQLAVIAPGGDFASFQAQIDMAAAVSEFQLGLGDWGGTVDLEFFLRGVRIASVTSSRFSPPSTPLKVFQMAGSAFDRVDFRATNATANFVITELGANVPRTTLETPSMTGSSTRIDPDDLPVGPVDAAMIRAAARPRPANCSLQLSGNFQGSGVYDAVTGLGNAIALDLRGVLRVIRPNDAYLATNPMITFDQPVYQFGVGAGDFTGRLLIDFYLGRNLVFARYRTSNYSTTSPVKFIEANFPFDRVELRNEVQRQNWVITELWSELAPSAAGQARPYGTGCGTAGPITIVPLNAPVSGAFFVYTILNHRPPTLVFPVFGISDRAAPGFGSLPFDLGALFPNLAGCTLLNSVDAVLPSFPLDVVNFSRAIAIPADRTLVGGEVYLQMMFTDSGLGQPGIATSNGVALRIGT